MVEPPTPFVSNPLAVKVTLLLLSFWRRRSTHERRRAELSVGGQELRGVPGAARRFLTGAGWGTLSLLAAATVAATGEGDGPYTSDLLNQTGLHPGIVIAFLLLCIPALAFAARGALGTTVGEIDGVSIDSSCPGPVRRWSASEPCP
ncbi:hypothetical protein [Kineosporia babensis]|uniref:Uncharacterized protein n=1 Tax=Kineosporia babensis TaxID=499548 RepID=A0A9X1NB83_9ACTN|nr:hypothetical protein [Kineosporia babensis]MCD5310606.1 hypothetical protein [Kineosporia babensis]